MGKYESEHSECLLQPQPLILRTKAGAAPLKVTFAATATPGPLGFQRRLCKPQKGCVPVCLVDSPGTTHIYWALSLSLFMAY